MKRDEAGPKPPPPERWRPHIGDALDAVGRDAALSSWNVIPADLPALAPKFRRVLESEG